ncbi:hypothetical protein EV380_1348 [Zhihengliuella halotolerans]|uniref:Uncharacterized protein n=2 Tax=Zhihengliuella halotolerans TaxID=370736 RepID=A0A4Q8AC48_9MICC|nr:hypothetical protein EV380_1348 [Zhihengliuella halotolerans]
MEPSSDARDVMTERTLADLIEAARQRDTKPLSYDSLSKLCGGKPSPQRLNQYATGVLKNFPDPDSLRGLSRGTGHSIETLLRAAARSLGLTVGDDNDSAIIVAGASELPDSARDAVKSVVQELVQLASEARHAKDPRTEEPPHDQQAAVGSNHAGQEQKTGPLMDPTWQEYRETKTTSAADDAEAIIRQSRKDQERRPAE